jgi:hypothetical protein
MAEDMHHVIGGSVLWIVPGGGHVPVFGPHRVSAGGRKARDSGEERER